MNGRYVLNDAREPVEVDDLHEWAEWYEQANRLGTVRVAHDEAGGVRVSTIFLALDHSFGRRPPPILFETMVFGGVLDGQQGRYCTWAEAEAGHTAMLKRTVEAAEMAGKET